eukprot:8912075-Alexandrium_andersonii.AAC.1
MAVQQGVMVIHGRQLWSGLKPAPDGMHLTWDLPNVFRILNTLKALANFLMLFCQFHGVPPRNTFHESSPANLVRIELDRRWADYFKNLSLIHI